MPTIDYSLIPLTLECVEAGTITINCTSGVDHTIEYSRDGGTTWTQLSISTTATALGNDFVIGDTVQIRNVSMNYTNTNVSMNYTNTTTTNHSQFGGTAKFNVYGNILSFISADLTMVNLINAQFYYLFASSKVLSAEHLIIPFMTLTDACYRGMFKSSSITIAPELPATSLATDCYNEMFYNCKSLTAAVNLMATNLANTCYKDMFMNCTNLTTCQSILPATTLAPYCYQSLFHSTAITTVPELPATTMCTYCYWQMFEDCKSLVSVPTNLLPGTIMAPNCYDDMFYGCTNLTNIPNLPSTSLASSCYADMFYNCTSLTNLSSITLPASTLADHCYYQMFYGCAKLTNLPVFSGVTLASSCCYAMFYGCTSLITIPSNYFSTVITLASNCFEGMFNSCTKLTNIVFPSVNILANSCYKNMYRSCTSLTNLSSYTLPGTTLASHCYDSTFYGCNKITVPPILPATTMAEYCYQNMFNSCTKLESLPILSATILAEGCYFGMFGNCTSLTTAPALPATTLASSCYQNMFQGCTSLTDLNNYNLPATTLAQGCYQNMFQGCISLVYAPTLKAKYLAVSCYQNMFSGCTSLIHLKCLAIDRTPTSCITNWLYGISTNGTLEKNNLMFEFTTSDIPATWIIVNANNIFTSLKVGNEWKSTGKFYKKINGVWTQLNIVEFLSALNSCTSVIVYNPTDIDIDEEEIIILSIAGPSIVNSETMQYVGLVNGEENNEITYEITSGSAYASINSSTGILTVLSGAEDSPVTIACHYDTYTTTKNITVTYNEGVDSTVDVEVETATDPITGDTITTTTTTISTTNSDGSSSETVQEVAENSNGSSSSTTTTHNYDENGDPTGSSINNTIVNQNGSSESHTTNYDEHGDPTDAINELTDVSGNLSTQNVEYDNGTPVVTAYNIDTTNNPNGYKDVTGTGVNTEYIPFTSNNAGGFEIIIKFRTKASEQPNPPLVQDTEDTNWLYNILGGKSASGTWPGLDIRWTGIKSNSYSGAQLHARFQTSAKLDCLIHTLYNNASDAVYYIKMVYDPNKTIYSKKTTIINMWTNTIVGQVDGTLTGQNIDLTLGYALNKQGQPYRYANCQILEFEVHNL